MAITVGICGASGEGKSTGIRTLDPKTNILINADGKTLPFKNSQLLYNKENKNYIASADSRVIRQSLELLNTRLHVKQIVIDTMNAIMLDTEMSTNFRNRKSGGEAMTKWMDLAAEIYDLILYCNSMRDDIVIYMLFHVGIFTDVDGNEKKCIVTNGRKLEKIHLETKLPLVLYTKVTYGKEGKNTYELETQALNSTGKTPHEMFDKFLIPNDFKLIDDKIREYYSIK